jgi:hypothetical protein
MMPGEFDTLQRQFEQAMNDCKALYLQSARDCIEHHPTLIPDSPREFLQLMGDLHKGLLIKIYVTVVEADKRWTTKERRFAAVLFAHIWKQKLTGKDLVRAAERVFNDANDLKWYSLVRPFDQIAPLRARIGQLETVVLRLANILAKVDGEIHSHERQALRRIQHEIDTHLRRLPLDEPGHHEQAQQHSTQAIEMMRRESAELREQCELTGNGEEEVVTAPSERLAEALAELDGLVGLDGVKQQVRTLTNFLKLQKQRRDAGLPETDLGLHMVFCGNPGTGKTTVARIIGQIYGSMGILKQGHLVETDRSGLVAAYAGQTGPKTNKKIDEALDGVLFIDEAYSLVANAAEDPYGHEAIQTLLKRMEDDRVRLVVILAGYPEPMQRLLKSNPGLSSRFNTNLTFDDYSPSELGLIFQTMCSANQYELPGQTRSRLLAGFYWLHKRRDEHFGNGRLARNTFEDSIRQLANRIVGMTPVTQELLTVLEPVDIKFAGLPNQRWDAQTMDKLQVVITCQQCGANSRLAGKHLSRRVKCNRCQHRFIAGWGEPVLE